MDLIGMSVREKRRKQKFTVLTRTSPHWTREEISLITAGVSNEVYSRPERPDVAIIWGEYPREVLAAILGENIGDYKIVTGYENPELPFVPSIS